MSEDNPSRRAPRPTDEPPEEDRRFSRRKFLAASAVGVGGLAFPTCGTAARRPDSPRPPDPPGPDRRGRDETPAWADDDIWFEPWQWRVWDHPEDALPLVVTEGTNPNVVIKNGQKTVEAQLFTYNGSAPGPTIRMRGDDVLRVHLFNTLGGNNGPYANTSGARFAKRSRVPSLDQEFTANDPVPRVQDWELAGSLLYGPHEQHTTNLHTHGLHVSSAQNPNGTFSDNVLIRVIPTEDYNHRAGSSPRIPLKDREVVGDASYEFRLGTSSGAAVERHPPGTHWYHPHPHGATFDQVACGMAGLILVEGDVDDALRPLIARERPFILQRIVPTPPTEAEGDKIPASGVDVATLTVNGRGPGTLEFTMQAGSWERWRVLNGSVDGLGYLKIMVVEGTEGTGATQPLNLLAFDGITLVREGETGKPEYFIQDLGGQYDNSMLLSPANRADFLFQAPSAGGTYQILAWYSTDAVDQTAPPIPCPQPGPDCPQPPPGTPPKYFVVATVHVIESDRPIHNLPELQTAIGACDVPQLIQPIGDAELDVGVFRTGENNPSGRWRVRRLVYAGWGPRVNKNFSDAPPQAQVTFTGGGGAGATATALLEPDGAIRSVSVTNGGCNYTSAPTVEIRGAPDSEPATCVASVENGRVTAVEVIQGGRYPFDFAEPNSMTIDGRKFDSAVSFHTMGLGTTEQWTLENQSLTVYAAYRKSPDRDERVAEGEYWFGATADSQAARFWEDPANHADYDCPQGIGRSADHPFHMHQNPFLVVGIYDAEGYPLDWNYKRIPGGTPIPTADNERFRIPANFTPRWQDVVRLPRNGGRVVIRSRFWDYTGPYVNHCHILNHEDWGMMQTVAVVSDPFDADFDSPERARGIRGQPRGFQYGQPSERDMFWNCLTVLAPMQPQQPEQDELFCAGVATPRTGDQLPTTNPDGQDCNWQIAQSKV